MYQGYHDAYYYAKSCLRICKLHKQEIPDILITRIKQSFMNSKKILELLIELKEQSICAQQELIDEMLLVILSNAKGT